MHSSSQPAPSSLPEGDARMMMGDSLITDLPEAQRRLSALLGRDEPVSVEVLHAAVEDPIYAMHLMASRSSPELMSILLARAPRRNPVDALNQAIPEPANPSKTALLGRFARAMAEWSKSGFQLADPDIRTARLEACRACPDLRAPGGSLLMRIASSAGLDGHSCGLCGCSVAAKSRIARESCPGEDPARNGYNRWGQQIPAR